MSVAYYETLVSEDLNVGTGLATVTHPAGGSLVGTQIGVHTFGLGLAKTPADWSPGTVSQGASTSTTVSVAGASIGDFVLVSISDDTQGCLLTGSVTSSNTVTVLLANLTGASVTFSDVVAYVLVLKSR